MSNSRNQNDLIIPSEQEQVEYYTRKWGITKAQLNDAILNTGSLRAKVLKEYFLSKPFVFSINNLITRLRFAL